MGDPQKIEQGLDLFRTLVFDNLVEAALEEYSGGLINIPVIGPIFRGLILGFADTLYKKLSGVIVFGSILFVDVEHRKAFDASELTLKKVAIEKGIDSQEFRDAHEKEKLALKKFGQFGVAQP